MQVQRGEKGTKIGIVIEKAGKTTDDDGQSTVIRIPQTSSVFCRCQVKPAQVTVSNI